jgi:hypothetical protein
MDDVLVSFENIMDISMFSLRLTFKDLERIPEILLAVPQSEIEAKQRALGKVWRRFFYSGLKSYNVTVTNILEENAAKVQPTELSLPSSETIFDPSEDDAFATIIQWLHSRIE